MSTIPVNSDMTPTLSECECMPLDSSNIVIDRRSPRSQWKCVKSMCTRIGAAATTKIDTILKILLVAFLVLIITFIERLAGSSENLSILSSVGKMVLKDLTGTHLVNVSTLAVEMISG